MLKFITNLIFIMIIFVLATALPLSTDIISLNITQPIVDPVTETGPISEPLVLTWEEISHEESTWILKLSANRDSVTTEWLNDFQLVVNGQKTDESKSPLSILAQSETMTDHLRVEIPLTDLFSSYPQDFYTLELRASGGDFTSNSVMMNHSTYMYTGSYGGSSNQIDDYMRLYYPNETYTELIPVSMKVEPRDNRWRTLYSALSRSEIDDLGLYSGYPIVPYSPNIRISEFIATVYLYSDELAPFEGKFDLVSESISRSLLSLGYINGVKFIVNDQSTGTYENIDLNTVFNYDSELTAYSSYKGSNDQVYLFPIPLQVSEDSTFDQQLSLIWSTMKYENPEVSYPETSMQLIPPQVELLDYSIDNSILTLRFSEDFNLLYNDIPWLVDLMNDSIIESFCSIPQVDQVQFNGQSSPQSPKNLINIIK